LDDFPKFEIIIDPGSASYSANLSVFATTKGATPCKIRMDLPGDATMEDAPGVANIMKDQGSEFQRHAEALVPIKTEGAETPQISGFFKSSLGFRREGWGRDSLYLIFGNGLVVEPEPLLPFPEKPGTNSPQTVKLSIDPPLDSDRLVTIAPSGAETDAQGKVTWTLGEPELPHIYKLTYENSYTRYWAEHAINIVLLSIGALLGVMLAARERPTLVGNSVPARVSTTMPTQVSKHSSHHRPYFFAGMLAGFVLATLFTRHTRRRNQ
jgi:hypothetical protein